MNKIERLSSKIQNIYIYIRIPDLCKVSTWQMIDSNLSESTLVILSFSSAQPLHKH